jgi:hypothetical protein
MLSRRQAALVFGAALTSFAEQQDSQRRLRMYRVPNDGIQPQVAVDDIGTLIDLDWSHDIIHVSQQPTLDLQKQLRSR